MPAMLFRAHLRQSIRFPTVSKAVTGFHNYSTVFRGWWDSKGVLTPFTPVLESGTGKESPMSTSQMVSIFLMFK